MLNVQGIFEERSRNPGPPEPVGEAQCRVLDPARRHVPGILCTAPASVSSEPAGRGWASTPLSWVAGGWVVADGH